VNSRKLFQQNDLKAQTQLAQGLTECPSGNPALSAQKPWFS